MAERTTVRLPDELLRRAKQKASAEGRTLTSLVEEGLRAVLSDPKRVPPTKRVMPRVSKAKGGPLPGVDLSDLRKLEEMEDIEYVQRLARLK